MVNWKDQILIGMCQSQSKIIILFFGIILVISACNSDLESGIVSENERELECDYSGFGIKAYSDSVLLPDSISTFDSYKKWYSTLDGYKLRFSPVFTVEFCEGVEVPFSIHPFRGGGAGEAVFNKCVLFESIDKPEIEIQNDVANLINRKQCQNSSIILDIFVLVHEGHSFSEQLKYVIKSVVIGMTNSSIVEKEKPHNLRIRLSIS